MKTVRLLPLLLFSLLFFLSLCAKEPIPNIPPEPESPIVPLNKDKTSTINVIVVIQDPVIDGKRIHETARTPGYNFEWHDPWKLTEDYRKALSEISHGVIDYHIVEIIDAQDYFTYLKKSGEKLTEKRVVELLREPGWKTLKEQETGFDYKAFVEHYGFDKMRDEGKIHEVWVWTFPYGGMWESNMMGKNAFWLNSQPTKEVDCTELLCVMGLNYERDLACALESYGHRFESIMMEVYGWWAYDNKTSKEQLTNWEKYAAYARKYEKFNAGMSHIGNIHFPPNGEKDYDWANRNKVYTYAHNWVFYPEVKEEKARFIDCSEWECSHLGYMKWWFSHIPHFDGLNHSDGKLNNWWQYVVDYNKALLSEKKLKNQTR
jgi:hypothetical protein